MIKVTHILNISIISMLISACSPMNSEFSCNVTAGDSCLSIEQVDAMTRDKDLSSRSAASYVRQKHITHAASRKPNPNPNSLVWVAKSHRSIA